MSIPSYDAYFNPLTDALQKSLPSILGFNASSSNKTNSTSGNHTTTYSSGPSSKSKNYAWHNIQIANVSGNSRGKNDIRTAGLIFGALFLLGGAAALGKFVSDRVNFQREMKKVKLAIISWERTKETVNQNCLNSDARCSIFDKTVKHLNKFIKTQEQHHFDCIYKIALPIILSAGALVAGAAFGSGAIATTLFAAGTVGVVFAGAYGIYKLVRNYNDDSYPRLIQKLQTDYQHIKPYFNA